MEKPTSESPVYERVLQEEQAKRDTQAKQDKAIKSRRQSLEALGLIGQLGVSIAVSVLLPLLFGIWLDNVLGTLPLFILVFTLVGMAVALRNLLVMTNPTSKSNKSNKPSKRG